MEIDAYVFPYSMEEAKRLGRLGVWRESFKANVACKKAIEQAMRRDFDGMHLKSDCAQSVIEQFGFKRVSWVLSNTVQKLSVDERFNPTNKQWARQTYIPPDKNHNDVFVIVSNPNVLDSFINQYRNAYQALELFDHTHCEQESRSMNYDGKVLVLSPDTLKESCWRQEDQLWLATGGFGCDPNSSGRAVFATCLSDGEETRWNRADFIGVLKDPLLPEWAREKLTELQAPNQEQTGTPDMGGMNMT